MTYLMGIDLGTSSVKTLIMDVEGVIKSIESEEYTIDIPNKGYAEQDPEIWWGATVKTIRKALTKAGILASDIKSIGFSGQMHGMVPIDRENNLIRPAIIHVDQRSTKQIKQIYDKISRVNIGKITLNPLFPGFQIVSLIWLKEHEPQNYQKIKKVISPKDYIRFKMVNDLGTDYTDASGTLAFDTVNRNWAESIISQLGLDVNKFPKLGESFDVAGYLTESAALETGLKKGTCVVFGGADQPMQALGNGVIKSGTVTSTIGTSGIIYAPVNKPVYNPKLNTHTFCNIKPNSWYTMGAILSAGLCLRWLKENILVDKDFEYIGKEAQSIPVGSDGLIFLPYLVGERTPHLDSYAKGMFFGISLNHNRSHMARAVMEGVTFALKDSLEILKQLDIKVDKIIASGGGAKSKLWLQIQADMFGMDIYTTNTVEQACTGAALVAGVGCGIYSDIEESCEAIVKVNENPIQPIDKNVEKYGGLFEVYKELYQNNKGTYIKISDKSVF